jgi:hypothetical protein
MMPQFWILLHIFGHEWALGWLAFDKSYVFDDQIEFEIL